MVHKGPISIKYTSTLIEKIIWAIN